MLEALGKRYVLETWLSEDGSQWYTRWSDGWIQHGGFKKTSNSAIQVDFPVAFRDTNYTVFGFPRGDQVGGGYFYMNSQNITTTSVSLYIKGDESGLTDMNWYAEGWAI